MKKPSTHQARTASALPDETRAPYVSAQHQAEHPVTVADRAPPIAANATQTYRKSDKVDAAVGDGALSPALHAGLTVNALTSDDDAGAVVNILSVADKIERMAEAIRGGDMADVEALLIAQASTLNVIFATYCQRAARETLDGRADQLLLLALRAQACSRATLGTLVDLKFPRTTVIAKQANLAQGHQQVNNQDATSARGEQHGS